jgi:AcrR family transcriptional regulator
METALRLFLEQGFETTTLDQLVDAAELSKRTFFRLFPSKEACLGRGERAVGRLSQPGHRARAVRTSARRTSRHPGGDHRDQGRRVDAPLPPRHPGSGCPHPSTPRRSDLTSITVQQRLVEILEAKLSLDGRADVRLRLLGEIALGAWRCAARNWIRAGTGALPPSDGLVELADRVNEAFDAVPASLTFAAP